ncbi:MAG: DUF4139 domain-containing protein [Desulfovibrio sp.]|nr:DUF4139 domain-containing protein [Desulfovibrio sp.]
MKMQGIWYQELLLCLFLTLAGMAGGLTEACQASELSLVPPKAALLSQQGAILRVEQKALVEEHNGKSRLTLLVPAKAENLRIEVAGARIVQEENFPCKLTATSARAKRSLELKARLEGANTRLALVQERLKIWNIIPKNLGPADIEAWDSKKMQVLTALVPEAEALEREIQELTEELKSLPKPESTGKCVRVTLADRVKDTHLPVTYSYALNNCGWRAHYAFAIAPEKAKDRVVVRLMAKVWQESGMDWTDTEITLVTGSKGKLAPPPLRSWVLEAREERSKGREKAMYEESAAMPAAMMANARRSDSHSLPQQDTSGIYASWLLPARSLEQGESSMLISQKEWESPLLWIARPGISQGQVYLMARHEIAEGEVWPDGEAVFSVSGQETGKGQFAVKGPELVLYFGCDPRVSLEVVQDKRKRGESGFLGRDKTWTWAWTYVLHNSHSQPVRVRLERPDPQIVQEQISVRFEEKPKADVDAKKHIRFWELEVPASGTQTISHSLTIKAPESLLFAPTAP